MKLIFVTLLVVLLVELSYGKAGRYRPMTETEVAPAKPFPYELPELNPLDVHSLNSCSNSPNNGVPIRAWMGPCWNTEACQIPHCCGIISGRNSTFKIQYKAGCTFTKGVFNGNLAGLGFGNEADGQDCTPISLPFQVLVPPTLAGYSRTLTDLTTVPQYKGQIYEVIIPFRFVSTAMSTFGIKADFVAQIVDNRKRQPLCWGLYATLENADLAKSVGEVVTDVTTLDVLDNPFGTAQKVLPGILPDYNPPINLKKNLIGAINSNKKE